MKGKVLCINTKDSGMVIVALKEGGKIIKSLSEENKYGSQVLLPLIVKLLKVNNQDFQDLEGIEVEEGPGSFTGLKVGASVAQALGFALNIPVNGSVGKQLKLQYT